MPRVTRASTRARRAHELVRRRELLLEAAEALFRERGYAAATTDALAERAGVSVGTVYNLLGSKEDVYAAAVERIGAERVASTRRIVEACTDAISGIRQLAASRLQGYERERLFFVLFSCERASGVHPDPAHLPESVGAHYTAYLDLLGELLRRGIEAGLLAAMDPLHLALSFEGVLNAFMGYWTRPAGPPEGLADLSERFCESFLRMAGRRDGVAVTAAAVASAPPPRELFITRFDADRLHELIAVARGFGGPDVVAHLHSLDDELERAQVVEPSAVPPDVVTMNTRLRLRRFDTGVEELRTLVFPADAGREPGTLSVLEPLGTAVLGCRAGSDVEVFDAAAGTRLKFRVEAVVYQPEAAGDFHL